MKNILALLVAFGIGSAVFAADTTSTESTTTEKKTSGKGGTHAHKKACHSKKSCKKSGDATTTESTTETKTETK